MKNLLKEALTLAHEKLLRGTPKTKIVTKTHPLSDTSIEEINTVAISIGLDFKDMHVDCDECNGEYNILYQTTVPTSEEEKLITNHIRFNSVATPFINKMMTENGYTRISYDHRAFSAFEKENNLVYLTSVSSKSNYTKTTLYDLYLEEKYELIEAWYTFYFKKTEEEA